MLQTNGISTLLDTLSISFKYIEDIKYRVNNKRKNINVAATNRLIISKSFSIHNEHIKITLKTNECLNIDND